MVNAGLVFELGILVSVVNVILWIIILRSQVEQYSTNKMNNRIKNALLVFGIAALSSNFVPIWFDIFQLLKHVRPSNIGVAYITSQYLFRTLTAFMFYLIYKF